MTSADASTTEVGPADVTAPSAADATAPANAPDVTPSASEAHAASSGEAHAAASGEVRHRTERDSLGRVWRFVFDPAAQDSLVPPGMVRIRCTTGTGRATLVVREDWLEWPRQQLLNELTAALQLQRGGAVSTPPTDASGTGERKVARRRLVRLANGAAWNCVYDPSLPSMPGDEGRVRVRCTAGRDRIELLLDPVWHRLGDRQLAALITESLASRRR